MKVLAEDARVARSRGAILQATAQLLAESGFAGFSMDDVAHRAGVGKATIYRHWRSRAELLVDVCASLDGPVPVPDSGDLRTDLIELLAHLQRVLLSPATGPVIAALVEGAERDAELRRLRQTAVHHRREAFHVVLRRAVDRGDLPPDTDVELTAELLVAPLFFRRLVSRGRMERTFVNAVVDAVMQSRVTTHVE